MEKIEADGNVSLGTTNPSYKLKIEIFIKHNGNYGYKDIAPDTFISINAYSFFDLIKGVVVVSWQILKDRLNK